MTASKVEDSAADSKPWRLDQNEENVNIPAATQPAIHSDKTLRKVTNGLEALSEVGPTEVVLPISQEGMPGEENASAGDDRWTLCNPQQNKEKGFLAAEDDRNPATRNTRPPEMLQLSQAVRPSKFSTSLPQLRDGALSEITPMAPTSLAVSHAPASPICKRTGNKVGSNKMAITDTDIVMSTSPTAPRSPHVAGSKRTFSGTVKTHGATSLPGSPMDFVGSPALPKSPNYDSSRIQELSSQLRTRLKYARIKVDNNWTTKSLDQVESIYSNQSSPTTGLGVSCIHIKRQSCDHEEDFDMDYSRPCAAESKLTFGPPLDSVARRRHGDGYGHSRIASEPVAVNSARGHDLDGMQSKTYEEFWKETAPFTQMLENLTSTVNPSISAYAGGPGTENYGRVGTQAHTIRHPQHSDYSSPLSPPAMITPRERASEYATGTGIGNDLRHYSQRHAQNIPCTRRSYEADFTSRPSHYGAIHRVPPTLRSNLSNLSTYSTLSTSSTISNNSFHDDCPATPPVGEQITKRVIEEEAVKDAVVGLMFLSSPGNSQPGTRRETRSHTYYGSSGTQDSQRGQASRTPHSEYPSSLQRYREEHDHSHRRPANDYRPESSLNGAVREEVTDEDQTDEDNEYGRNAAMNSSFREQCHQGPFDRRHEEQHQQRYQRKTCQEPAGEVAFDCDKEGFEKRIDKTDDNSHSRQHYCTASHLTGLPHKMSAQRPYLSTKNNNRIRKPPPLQSTSKVNISKVMTTPKTPKTPTSKTPKTPKTTPGIGKNAGTRVGAS